ncbi:MAG: hypothetical protein JWN61_2335 [Pseudonocardiales bacterium]|nr:hypothetical protein [Pseudonocardiales bacterium]
MPVQPPPPPYGTPPLGPQYGPPAPPQYGPPQYGFPPPAPQYSPQYSPQSGWAQSFWTPPAPLGPRRSVRVLGWVGVAAAVVGVIGSRITWAEVTGFAARGVYVTNPEIEGREIGVGTFCLVLCLAIAVLCGVLAWRTVLGCAIAVLSIGCVLLLIGALNVVAVDRIAGPNVEQYGLTATIGPGLWMTFAAGLAASVVGLMATIRANSRIALPSRWDAPPPASYSQLP